jgi:hypothetical protein
MAMVKATEAEVKADVDRLMGELRKLADKQNAHALMAALAEMYARVVSDCIHNEAEMEKAASFVSENTQRWWRSDRGGSFLVS